MYCIMPTQINNTPQNNISQNNTATTVQDTNFATAYATLEANAQKLAEQADTLDLDTLTQILDESAAAYQICQARIATAEAALAKFDALE